MAYKAMIGLFVLAVLVVLYHSGNFMVPVIGAILLNLVLSPISRALHRIYIPNPVSAALIVLVLFALVAGAFYGLSNPVSRWISAIPQAVQKIEVRVAELKSPLEDVQRATSEVEKMTSVEGSGENKPQPVVVKETSLTTRLFGSATNMILEMGLMFVLLYFMLAVGDLFHLKLVHIMPSMKDKLQAEQIASAVVRDISIYLGTITLINAVLGMAVGLALFALGLPNPVIWGIMAGLLNFVPYLGATVGISIVAIASLITFDSVGTAILPPLAYAAINMTEGQFITPSIVSRNLTLNPVVVFLSVSFWAWFWGIPGALMAVPILVIIKILGDHILALRPIGEFLGGRDRGPSLPGPPPAGGNTGGQASAPSA